MDPSIRANRKIALDRVMGNKEKVQSLIELADIDTGAGYPNERFQNLMTRAKQGANQVTDGMPPEGHRGDKVESNTYQKRQLIVRSGLDGKLALQIHAYEHTDLHYYPSILAKWYSLENDTQRPILDEFIRADFLDYSTAASRARADGLLTLLEESLDAYERALRSKNKLVRNLGNKALEAFSKRIR